MSTRSYIGIENANGTVDYVYCHNDGYPSGVGAKLVSRGRRDLRELISEGDRSSLDLSYKAWRDEDCPAAQVVSRQAYQDELAHSDCDYAYLLTRSGAWLIAHHGGPFTSLKRLLKTV